jgi:hypothetical protein
MVMDGNRIGYIVCVEFEGKDEGIVDIVFRRLWGWKIGSWLFKVWISRAERYLAEVVFSDF